MDFFKSESPICGYVEAILGRRQILQDKKYHFTDTLQNMLEKNSKSQIVVLCLTVSAFIVEATWSPN